MKPGQIIIPAAAILAVVILAMLPRGVVENNRDLMETQNTQPDSQSPVVSSAASGNTGADGHAGLPPEVANRTDSLRALIESSEDKEKSITFADSLASLYASVQKTDSAAHYATLIAEWSPGPKNWLRAGEAWFEAFSFAIQPDRVAYFGDQAAKYLQKAIEADNSLIDAQVMVAMTKVASDNPMQGILSLRELAEKHPENVMAQFHLGRFSMQTGQFAKAVERFTTVLGYEPGNEEARYLLAESLWRDGQGAKAINELTTLIAQTEKEEVHAAAQTLLQEIRK